VVFGSAFKADFKEKPSLLGYLLLGGIRYRHLSPHLKGGLISSFLFATLWPRWVTIGNLGAQYGFELQLLQ
jgi:hypothetical protein